MRTSDLCGQKIGLTRPDISAANALTIFFTDVRFPLNKTLTHINLTPHNGDCRFSRKTLCTMEPFNSIFILFTAFQTSSIYAYKIYLNKRKLSHLISINNFCLW